MKTERLFLLSTALALGLLTGCGPTAAERAAKERERLEQEKQAQREIQKSNEAVNEVSKKLGRKPPAMDLGVQTQTVPVSPPPKP